MSPVDWAVELRDTDNLRALLASGPKLGVSHDSWVSALYIAVQQGYPKASDAQLF